MTDPWQGTPQWRMAILWAWWVGSRPVYRVVLAVNATFGWDTPEGRDSVRQYLALTATWPLFRAMMARDLGLR